MSPACRGPMVAKPPVEHRANVSRTMPRARGNDDTRHIETPRTETPHTDERRSHTPRIEAPRDKTPRSSVCLRGIDASTDASVSHDVCAGRSPQRRGAPGRHPHRRSLPRPCPCVRASEQASASQASRAWKARASQSPREWGRVSRA